MLLFDILIGTLIVLPLLSDAVWYDPLNPYSLDLSDLGIPILAAALIVLLARRLSRMQGSEWRAAIPVAGGLLVIVLLSYWAIASGVVDAERVSNALWSLKSGPGAAFVVGLAAVAVRRWSPEPWEKSFFVRLGTRVGLAWLGAVERSPVRALWGVVTAMTALFFWVGLLRYRAFDSHGFDLGIFTNALWNLVHGNGYVSSVKGGINLFLDHQSPLFWAMAPFFWVAPRPETLLLVQAFGLSAGGPALYHLARAHFGRGHWAPAALPWLYWLWLPMRNAAAFDFHPEVFMLPLTLWACVGFASDRRWAKALGIAALLGALGAKESAGVVVFGIGIAWILTGGPGPRSVRWPGIVFAAAGAAAFWFDVQVVPRMLGGEYAYLNLYERFGGGIGSVLTAPFTQPVYFFSQVLNPARLNFLLWTLAPLAFLPLFDWRAAVAVLPPYLVLFLSQGDQRVKLMFHYGIEPGTALFWALPFGVAVCARRFGWRNTGIWMLFWAVAFMGPSELTRARSYQASDHARWLTREALPCLDPGVSMAATDVLIPHLATRRWISYPDLLEQKPSRDPVACVVTDLTPRIDNWPLGTSGTQEVVSSLPARGYREVFRCGEFRVHELAGSTCLRCTPRCD